MAKHSKLESLPAELQLEILNNLPDISTLSALVHATPILRRVYASNREKILTGCTLRELRTRVREPKIYMPIYHWNLQLRTEHIDPHLEPAIASYRAQSQDGTINKIRLSVEECIALRTVVRISAVIETATWLETAAWKGSESEAFCKSLWKDPFWIPFENDVPCFLYGIVHSSII